MQLIGLFNDFGQSDGFHGIFKVRAVFAEQSDNQLIAALTETDQFILFSTNIDD
jgi:hypothetical protein